ncbi:hypothetical protein [Brevundimonas sp.]|uniref:hypothetical protein n=1 Tax=Brevundimonas sp. TaxID=1871086 RepID=UPI002737ECB9|nr:hypothetical protein [Brevundimonas sp.]MDP3803124.1 hypothetical protein [Brevundimonas sp.]
MLWLKATLVARTAARPWRVGWPLERGVDFAMTLRVPPTVAPPTERDPRPHAEPACFLDEDLAVPSDLAIVRTFVSLAAAEAASVESAPEAAGLRAWWSLASKPPRA